MNKPAALMGSVRTKVWVLEQALEIGFLRRKTGPLFSGASHVNSYRNYHNYQLSTNHSRTASLSPRRLLHGGRRRRWQLPSRHGRQSPACNCGVDPGTNLPQNEVKKAAFTQLVQDGGNMDSDGGSGGARWNMSY